MKMERQIYVNKGFCAVTENDRLVEFLPARETDQTGCILTGRIERMMPGLDAAFVDIGRNKAGFLPLNENSGSFTGGRLRSGDSALVQIRKEENGSKGAFLTRDLSIPGTRLILMPMNRHIGISARIKDESVRQELLRMGRELSGGRFGLVMREASAGIRKDMLQEELARLITRWDIIRQHGCSAETVEDELIRDYSARGQIRILRDEDLTPDLERQRKEAGNRRIRLPHGGNIVIDTCEALTAVDVNSASDNGEGNRRETALRTNLEACLEAMIQIRLRNLSGILILDFIDMEEEEDRQRVQKALEEAFSLDRIKTVIHGFTKLGLMEMTRKRSRTTWQECQST